MIRSFRTEVSFPSTFTTQVWVHIHSDAQTPNPTLGVTLIAPDGRVANVGEYDSLDSDDEVNNIILRSDDASPNSDGCMEGEHTVRVGLEDGDELLELAEGVIDIEST